jgi:hypothetical protein
MQLRNGKVLLAVQASGDPQAELVRGVFSHGGAEEIITTGEPAGVEAAPRVREEKWEKW